MPQTLFAKLWRDHTVAELGADASLVLVDRIMRDADSIGSPGIDNLRWLKPVRPGDVLRARFTVVEARVSNSRPDWGIVRSRGEVLNQNEELVMQVEAVNFFGRRQRD